MIHIIYRYILVAFRRSDFLSPPSFFCCTFQCILIVQKGLMNTTEIPRDRSLWVLMPRWILGEQKKYFCLCVCKIIKRVFSPFRFSLEWVFVGTCSSTVIHAYLWSRHEYSFVWWKGVSSRVVPSHTHTQTTQSEMCLEQKPCPTRHFCAAPSLLSHSSRTSLVL